MVGMNTSLHHIKQLVKIALDTCLLPGAGAGTEVLWLYVTQWNKKASAICFAMLSLLTINAPDSDVTMVSSHAVSEIENN
jgi:hypothetical protein